MGVVLPDRAGMMEEQVKEARCCQVIPGDSRGQRSERSEDSGQTKAKTNNYLSVHLPVISLINCLVYLVPENSENAHHNFLEPRVMLLYSIDHHR